MPHMAVEAGDAATWAGVAASVAFSGAALLVSIRSLRHARRAADAAQRQAVAAEKVVPPAIAWQIEHEDRFRYVSEFLATPYILRNVGIQTATGVTVDSAHGEIRMVGLDDGTVISGGSFTVLIKETNPFGPKSNEVFVSWDGQPQPVAVALPPEPPKAPDPPPFVKTTPWLG